MALRTVRIPSGTTQLNPFLWGTGQRNARSVMEKDLNEDITRQTPRDERTLPKEMDIKVGGGGFFPKNTKPHWRRIVQTKFGYRTIARSGTLAQIDVAPLARKIMQMLVLASPPSQSGHYRASFRYVIGRRFTKTLPLNPESYTAIGVANIAAYASTLDAPRRWTPRPFDRVFKLLRRNAEFRDAELRHGPYIASSSEEIRTLGKRGDKYSGLSAYSVPVIWVAPIGAMATTKHTFRRRRGRRIKRP